MPGSSPGHAVYLNFAIGKHHNFAVTALVHLMRFMLNIMHLMSSYGYSSAMACSLSLPARLQSG